MLTIVGSQHYRIIYRIWQQTVNYIHRPIYGKKQVGTFDTVLSLREKSSGQVVKFFSLKSMELQTNSRSEELFPEGNVNKSESNTERSPESWLEDGFGILFNESQSSNELSVKKKEGSKKAKACMKKGMEEDSEDGPSKSKKKKKNAKKNSEMPDHFIALQIRNPEIQKEFADVQEKIVSQSPSLIHAMVSVQKLHITVMPVCLPTQDRIDIAKSALDVCAAKLHTDYRDRLIVLGVAGIGNFRNNVLFAKVAASDPSQHNVLQHISDVVNDSFAEHGIKNTDKKSDFKPHITIAKLSKNFRKLRLEGIKKIDPSLYEDQIDRHFGHQVLTSIQLCSMFKKDLTTGYYKILHEASFGPQQISNLTLEEQSSETSAADIIVQWSVKSAMEKCMATTRVVGDESKNVKPEESRHDKELLSKLSDNEKRTRCEEELDTDSDLCSASVNGTLLKNVNHDPEVNQVDSFSKVEVVKVSTEEEIEKVCRSEANISSDVNTCVIESSKEEKESSDTS